MSNSHFITVYDHTAKVTEKDKRITELEARNKELCDSLLRASIYIRFNRARLPDNEKYANEFLVAALGRNK